MSRRGRSQNPHNQIQRMDNMMNDPFAHMHQMMRGFGGMSMFGKDDNMFGLMHRMNDPFEDMFKFSDIHKEMHDKGKSGSYVSQTFVSSSTMGQDGKMKSQHYYQNSMGQHQNGQTISQKKQAYKNSDGINRIAQERMLNDRGRKIVKQKRGNDIEETNHYYNMDEQDVQQFDNNWKGTNNKLKFIQNHQKYLNNGQRNMNMDRMLGYQPRNGEYYGGNHNNARHQHNDQSRNQQKNQLTYNNYNNNDRNQIGSRSSKQSGYSGSSGTFGRK